MKVFGIGLSKTGRTSLCKALCILGLRVISFPLSYAQLASLDGADRHAVREFDILDESPAGC